MIRTLIVAVVAISLASTVTYADKGWLLFGVGGSGGGGGGGGCTGTIDLSNGCILPTALGLVP